MLRWYYISTHNGVAPRSNIRYTCIVPDRSVVPIVWVCSSIPLSGIVNIGQIYIKLRGNNAVISKYIRVTRDASRPLIMKTGVYWILQAISDQHLSKVIAGPHFALDIDGLGQERRNSSALAMELRLSCTNLSIWKYPIHTEWLFWIWFINLYIVRVATNNITWT